MQNMVLRKEGLEDGPVPLVVSGRTQIAALAWVPREGETARAMLCRDLFNPIADVPKLNGSPIAHAHPALDAKLLAVQIPAAPAMGRATSHKIDRLAIDR
jgi:hypothetical protein